ncbi:MAG: FUSC family protein [Chromatiales bacterium]
MTISGSGSGLNWERNFFTFLRHELAPSPARWRATLRISAMCAVAIVLVMALHIPDGEFLLVTLFVVSQSDAWASLTKAWFRVIGTALGGAFAIFVLLACADKPWILFPFHAVVIAVALFLSRTTTVPYAFLLGGMTFFIVVPEFVPSPTTGLERGLWRIFLTVVGVLLAVAAQFGLWPDGPEELLLTDLAARLRDVERTIDRLVAEATATATAANMQSPTALIATTGLARHLDLLANAEAMDRWLRQRHTEQVKLITDLELLVIAALRLDRVIAEQESPVILPDWVCQRLRTIEAECTRLRHALEERRPPQAQTRVNTGKPIEEMTTDTIVLKLLPSIREMERTLTSMPRAMAFLGAQTEQPSTRVGPSAPAREPVAEQHLFTPDCTLANIEMIQFALKGALAVSICGLVIQAFDWPGLSTSLITCVVVAQPSFGAGLRKALLRLSGATVGGVASLLVIVVLMPNLESLPSFLVVMTGLFTVAAWLVTGSSRISYVGLQIAIPLCLVLIDSLEPTIDIGTARDRVLGVLLGIVVTGVVDLAMWPVFARSAVSHKLASVLRAIAERHRLIAQRNREQTRKKSFAIHRDLTNTLSVQDDLLVETALFAPDPKAEYRSFLQLTNHIQEVFLRSLTVGHHHFAMDWESLPQRARGQLHDLNEAVAHHLEALAAQLDGQHETTATFNGNARLSELSGDLSTQLQQNPIHTPALRQLQDHCTLYRELLAALAGLEQELSTLTLSLSLTGRGQHEQSECG